MLCARNLSKFQQIVRDDDGARIVLLYSVNVATRGIDDKRWVKAAAYWRRGAGVHENITDED